MSLSYCHTARKKRLKGAGYDGGSSAGVAGGKVGSLVRTTIGLVSTLVCLCALCAPSGLARRADCDPAQAVFYTSGDWSRLAHGLAADASPCTQYYVSIPPTAASKTALRSGAAAQVRALGVNFHALAEINYAAWQSWVNSTGSSWYQAGQEARRRMAKAGYDIGSGDTWAVNELSSAVVNGTGQTRQNVEQLVAGLHDGDGSVQPTTGIVFVVGVSQTAAPLPALKATLESWLQDSAFWTDMATNVSGFYQEAYGDVRSYAVSGVDPSTRVTYLAQFLRYLPSLAAAAPPSAAAAQAFLSTAYTPLANASWAYNASYGYTNVTSDVMADFVSAETYAMRSTGNGNLGFAWNTANPDGFAPSDFSAQSAGILARLAGAVHETDSGDPSQACEATGCASIVGGGSPAAGWSSFSTWTPTVPTFTTPPVSLDPATVSPSISLQLQTGGVPTALPNATPVTVTSSSPTAMLSLSPAGPWTPTLALTVLPGSTGVSFFAEDTTGGTLTLTASAAGQVATQAETIAAPVSAAPLPPPPPPPAQVRSLSVDQLNGRLHLALRVVDSASRPVAARLRLAFVSVPSTVFATALGRTDASGQLAVTASPKPPPGCYSVKIIAVIAPGFTWNGVTPTNRTCVLPAVAVGPPVFSLIRRHLQVALRLTGESGRGVGAHVELSIEKDGATFASSVVASGSAGRAALIAGPLPPPGCYTVHLVSITAPGYTWDGAQPRASYCIKPSPTLHSAFTTRKRKHLHVELRVSGTQERALRAFVSFAIVRNGAVFASTAGRTDAAGAIGLTGARKLRPGCYSVRVKSVTVRGYAWSGTQPSARFCSR